MLMNMSMSARKRHTVVPEPTLARAFKRFASMYRHFNVRTMDGKENHQGCLFECPLLRMQAQLGLNETSA